MTRDEARAILNQILAGLAAANATAGAIGLEVHHCQITLDGPGSVPLMRSAGVEPSDWYGGSTQRTYTWPETENRRSDMLRPGVDVLELKSEVPDGE